MLFAGCAQPIAWHRAGKAPYETQNDLESCWSDANAAVPSDPQPFQQQPAFGVVPTQNGGTRGAIVVPAPGPAGPDVSVLQRRNQLVDHCMRQHGYAPDR